MTDQESNNFLIITIFKFSNIQALESSDIIIFKYLNFYICYLSISKRFDSRVLKFLHIKCFYI